MRVKLIVKSILIAMLFLVILVIPHPPALYANDWVRAKPGERTWIDTSHYEWRSRYIDTSHWEIWWGWFWISSGYWTLISSGHEDTYYYHSHWQWSRPGYTLWWRAKDRQCPLWGWGVWQCVYTWDYHEHPNKVTCPGWSNNYFEWVYHDTSYWSWIDTSHWEWRPYWAWVSSGYWEQYLAWIPSGYWAEPLHGTVTISKSPSYVFTKWHYLTEDGRKHGDGDERAHIDLSLSWITDRPIASVQEYADVKRYDKQVSTERIDIATNSLTTPTASGTLESRVEYAHAGLGTHYFVLKAQDGGTATIFCDIPISGFTGININNANKTLPADQFLKSLQDTGTVTF